jgi:hypothetical protein
MRMEQSWHSLLEAPHARDHVVQLYTDQPFLVRTVTRFVGRGLVEGDAVILIATPEHAEAFKATLAGEFDVNALLDRGQLVVLDAGVSLAEFMIDGRPDPPRFFALVQRAIDYVRASGFPKVRLFGEMVNLLWRSNLVATRELEELWNEALALHGVSLLCAYELDNFGHEGHRGLLHEICASHSHFIPVEDYERLELAVARAYEEVFGDRGDAISLRTLMTAALSRPTRMPPAAGALLAARQLTPTLASEILTRARRYYESALSSTAIAS